MIIRQKESLTLMKLFKYSSLPYHNNIQNILFKSINAKSEPQLKINASYHHVLQDCVSMSTLCSRCNTYYLSIHIFCKNSNLFANNFAKKTEATPSMKQAR